MAELCDEDGAIYPKVDPELFARMPEDFLGYTQQHPDVLPSYAGFARSALDVAHRHSSDLVMLEGPHGIGKTTRLIPALLGAAYQEGYTPLGSLTVVKGQLGYDNAYVDGYRFMVRAPQGGSIHHRLPHHQINLENYRARIELAEQLRTRLRGAETEKAVLVIDEPLALLNHPDLADFVFHEARITDTSLIATQPKRYWQGGLSFKDVRLLSNAAAKPVLRVEIPEARVGIPQVHGLLAAVGVDTNLAERFETDPRLRRLRVLETFTNRILAERSAWKDDDFIWQAADLERLLQHSFTPREAGVLGYSPEDLSEIKSALVSEASSS